MALDDGHSLIKEISRGRKYDLIWENGEREIIINLNIRRGAYHRTTADTYQAQTILLMVNVGISVILYKADRKSGTAWLKHQRKQNGEGIYGLSPGADMPAAPG